MKKYNPKLIERKWQKKWAESGIYKDYSKPKKFYALDMFPYPSGAGLHVGHPKGYIATDVVSRFKMLNGFSVLHPMGWDAFGLPAENYAIQNKIHPEAAVKENIKTFKKQLGLFGFTYDWDREINTTDPEYYKWTQWIFLKMFEKGLAFESDEPINWCPSCQTGLALEDLENGLCERCGTQVVQKKMRQWVLKMTDYADRLLEDLDREELDWEKSIVDQQKNWIGRSEGAIVKFSIVTNGSLASTMEAKLPNMLEVFTTRLDTIFGCTYCVVGPEHPIIEKLKDQIKNYKEVEKYVIKAQNKTDLERTDLQKEKTGVELQGIRVTNPFNNEELPLFVADYVLGHYGTGAVMAVPAHDERDFEFAKKYKLPIKKVILPEELLNIPRNLEDIAAGARTELRVESDCFICDGKLVNSGKYSDLTSEKAREKMAAWLEKKKIGGKKVNYKMRDWVFSRQRYWGEPIPIIHCEKCGTVGVPEKDLPVELPKVEKYEPTGTGEGPLANIKEWVNAECPQCGGPGKRETNTMPQWAGSSWYYLRYIDPKNEKELVGKTEEKKWMPVDLYVGGAEHATRHLLYARFWHKFLYDIGVVSTKEPFKKLVHVGLIQGEDGRKMSKRWGNVINPDEVIFEYGADSIRLYEMFMGPFMQNIAWNTKGVVGMRRFLDKVWKLKSVISEQRSVNNNLEILLHKTIKKVTEDIESFRFNTAISALMIFLNELEKQERLFTVHCSLFIKLLSPFVPHIAEEIWEKLGHDKSIFFEKWPEYDPKLIKDEQIMLVIQINGKVRDQIEVASGVKEKDAKELALAQDKIVKYIGDSSIKKIIFVRDRLINFVI
ncbi:MAG: leucine--tRNA ligase [Candidatus Moranbacteria bacterium]|nr:leucine--tRNA ligase [Candidatus Moranbacteria bacterium]